MNKLIIFSLFSFFFFKTKMQEKERKLYLLVKKELRQNPKLFIVIFSIVLDIIYKFLNSKVLKTSYEEQETKETPARSKNCDGFNL